ncbi:MAG: hypothetical protein JWM76_4463 [Pseudonocardiales bacterium]|nr:hypothetical protein [Pseudonocardiales bacterium]
MFVIAAMFTLAGCSGTPAGGSSVRTVGALVSPTASTNDSADPTSGDGPTDPTSAAVGTALDLLATLAVKGRAPKTGYTRAEFGAAWTDDNDSSLGHNGCDTRNDILRRDISAITLKPGSHGCTVLTGVLSDPYTAEQIAFTRGSATSNAIQIDHVVALSNAWQMGAQQWSRSRRIAFANDPLNLLAVDGPANEAKGDGDAATWLPPNKAYRCAYVARQVAVKVRYALAVTAAEKSAIAAILASCPGQLVPM